jgi:hypothetical protein
VPGSSLNADPGRVALAPPENTDQILSAANSMKAETAQGICLRLTYTAYRSGPSRRSPGEAMAEPPIPPAYCERIWQEVWEIDNSRGRPRTSHIELTEKTLDPSIVSEAARARDFSRRISR